MQDWDLKGFGRCHVVCIVPTHSSPDHTDPSHVNRSSDSEHGNWSWRERGVCVWGWRVRV